ncbi:MAG TPA: aldo/keto reductase [Spirochaetia bacterium]|nr:aldo/keto reductase [Spirochaetia bacterium]
MRTNALVPPGLGLGCWQFGDMGRGTPDEPQAVELIRDAHRLGISHFDTAQDYGNGRSETVLGRAVSPFTEQAFVSTKMHAAGAPETEAGVQRSLARLGRPWVDLFYVHWPKTGLDIRPMMETLESLRAAGAVRLIGVSNFAVRDLEAASSAGRIDAYQMCYNLLWRYPERDVIPWCRERGVGIVTYSSIAQGLLSDTPRSPQTFEQGDARRNTLYYLADVWPHVHKAVEKMQALARRTGSSLSALAIQWVLGRSGVVSSLVGARSRDHISGNLAASRGRLDPSVEAELTGLSDEVMKSIPDVGNIFNFYP